MKKNIMSKNITQIGGKKQYILKRSLSIGIGVGLGFFIGNYYFNGNFLYALKISVISTVLVSLLVAIFCLIE